MKNFLYSHYMLYLLAALLLLVFFLPDITGPLPALAIGSAVIAFAFFVYSKWSAEENRETESDETGSATTTDNE